MSATDQAEPDPAQDPAIDRRSRAFLKELNDGARAGLHVLPRRRVDRWQLREPQAPAIHDFALLNGLQDVPSTATALRHAAAELARHLHA